MKVRDGWTPSMREKISSALFFVFVRVLPATAMGIGCAGMAKLVLGLDCVACVLVGLISGVASLLCCIKHL